LGTLRELAAEQEMKLEEARAVVDTGSGGKARVTTMLGRKSGTTRSGMDSAVNDGEGSKTVMAMIGSKTRCCTY